MALNIKLLSQICKEPGISAYETRIRKLILKEVESLVDEVDIDPMGNLIAIKRGKSNQKVMLAAHMDEIGFIAHHIDDDGFVRFQPVGGFDPKTLTSQRVILHGKKDIMGVMGSKPIHLMSPSERGKALSLTDFFIDTGMPRKEVLKYIEPGTPISRERELIEMGDCVNSKSLDNRVSVFILIEMLRGLKRKKPPCDIYAAFTVQEEVGLRGAYVAGHHVDPDYIINLDTTIAFDVPGAKPEEMVTRLGAGTAIKVRDGSVLCDYRMIAYLKGLANKKKIKWQHELLPAGGTDTAALQRMATRGAVAGAISIPTRHIHQTVEMAHKQDIQGSIDLLSAAVMNLDKYDWNF